MVIVGLVCHIVYDNASIHDNQCIAQQVSILMLQAMNCVYSKEADMTEKNTMRLKFSDHTN